MVIVVTGVTGFIGSHMARHFLARGHHVRGIGKRLTTRGQQRVSDLRDFRTFELLIQDLSQDASAVCERAEAVVHLAACTYVDHSILDPGAFVTANVLGSHRLLEDARRYRPRAFVQVSTDEVYGPIAEGAFAEDATLRPSNPYAATKAAADVLGHSYWKTFGLPVLVVRTTNNYGTWQHPQKAIPTFVREALRDNPLPIYGDGRHRRCWLAVEDFCCAIDLLVQRGQPGHVYHAGGADEIENRELGTKILALLRKPAEAIRFVPDHDIRPGHDRRYALKSGSLESIGWSRSHRLKDQLRVVVEWYKDNPAWLNG